MQETQVKKVPDSLVSDLVSNWFEGSATSQSVITPTVPTSTDKVDNKPDSKEDKKPDVKPVIQSPVEDINIAELVIPDEPVESPTAVPPTKATKPAEPTNSLGFSLDKLFQNGVLLPFDDGQPIKSEEELEELIKANKAEERKAGKEEALTEFLENLPEDVKYLVDYVKNGGTDTSSIYKLFNSQLTVQSLDTSTVEGAKNTVYTYYKDLGWSDEEIKAEIEDLQDSGEDKLKQKADKLKEKVDQIRESELQERLEEQKKLQAQQKKAQEAYVKTVHDTLKKGTIGDLALTKDEQNDIYNALVVEQYQTPYGTVTNRLGAKLDEIQFIKPNYELLAKVMMLLDNPEKYEQKIRESVKKEVQGDAVRKIKMENTMKPGQSAPVSTQNSKTISKVHPIFSQNPFK